ncbi:stalk domain-containing protein [Paenibacillus terreus]|uniref:Stalk domain-containing protein n=1 Tax=Paenibacillus terreus TaxID=1387834 RepID=A0ABV5BD56_9BACL
MKTTKILSVFTVILALILGTSSTALASLDHPEVYVNNEKIDKITRGGAFEARVSPIGITYVPFRPIFEKFNMNVYWDQETKSVTASGTDMTLC